MTDIASREFNCKTAGTPAADPSDIPPGFDARKYPILSQHWFGWHPLGAVAAQVVQDLAFRRKVKNLVAKGDRVIGEMLAELAADRNLGTVIDELLDRFLAIPDAALEATNGRNFPPTPLHEVQS